MKHKQQHLPTSLLARQLPESLNLSPCVDRSHMVVDLENLCGGSEAVARHASSVYRALENTVSLDRTQVVVAVGVNAWGKSPNLGFQFPGARFLVGRGIDGADFRLLEDLIHEPQAGRSARVVIASGDGRFADAAQLLREAGVYLIGVSRVGCMSRRLRDAVHEVRHLPLHLA